MVSIKQRQMCVNKCKLIILDTAVDTTAGCMCRKELASPEHRAWVLNGVIFCITLHFVCISRLLMLLNWLNVWIGKALKTHANDKLLWGHSSGLIGPVTNPSNVSIVFYAGPRAVRQSLLSSPDYTCISSWT